MTVSTTPIDSPDPANRRAQELLALLNLAMFLVEVTAGMLIGSAALLADAVMFIDKAALFGVAVVSMGWSVRDRGWASLAQGAAMGLVGVCAVGQIVSRLLYGGVPLGVGMGAIAILALAVSLYCGWRLAQPARGVEHARGVPWSTRNDLMLNLAIVAAAGLVAVTRNAWPDLVIGAVAATFSLRSSYRVLTIGARSVFAIK